MSDNNHEISEEAHFDAWLDEGSWERRAGEFYECAGGHLWHEDEVVKEYEEACKNGWKSEG